MRNQSFILWASLLVHTIAPSSLAIGSQEQELERLRQRVAMLESELTSLRTDYEARFRAVEQRLAAVESQAASAGSPDPDVPSTPSDEASISEEDRAALEAEIAGILGESPDSDARGAGEQAPQPERRFTSQTRTLNELNPEISVTGDSFGTWADKSGDPETNQFRIAEFELAFQAPLDPFSMAKAFVVQEEGEFELEEAYIDWTALPGGLGAKFGAFRHDFGKINRWHQHALPQADRPLVHRALFGEDGLRGIGASISWLPSPFLGDYNELWVQVTNDQNDVSFSGRGFDEPIVTLHETNYWDLSTAAYLEVGVSASTGVNDDTGDSRTYIVGTDWNFDWRPPARALYEGLEVRGELLWQRREDVEEATQDSMGIYTYGTYKVNRRLFLGLRGDWTEIPERPGADAWSVSPYLEWWQSEWVRFRAQYSYTSMGLEEPESENRVFFQITWSLGPHKHERY